MAPAASVLIGLSARHDAASGLATRLEGAVRRYGLEPRTTFEADEAIDLVAAETTCAAFLDAEWRWPEAQGGLVWQAQGLATVLDRLVLMTATGRRERWADALHRGVAAVLPIPPASGTIRAALDAATGRRGERQSPEFPRTPDSRTTGPDAPPSAPRRW